MSTSTISTSATDTIECPKTPPPPKASPPPGFEKPKHSTNAKNRGCIFCSILKNDSNNQIIKKGPNVTAIQKHYDSKNVNFLLVSNKHIGSTRDLDLTDMSQAKIWCEFLSAARSLSGGKDYGLKFSTGKNAGQSVMHLHAHVYSYDKPWFPNKSKFNGKSNVKRHHN